MPSPRLRCRSLWDEKGSRLMREVRLLLAGVLGWSKILKSSKVHLQLVFKPCFYSSGCSHSLYSGLNLFFPLLCLSSPVLGDVKHLWADAAVRGYNPPVELQRCKPAVRAGGLEKAAVLWAWTGAPAVP